MITSAVSRQLLVATVASLLTAGAIAATALGANPRADTIARTIKAEHTPIFGGPDGVTVTARARLAFPVAWRKVSRSPSQLVLTEGQRHCQYTVRATTRVDATTDADAATHAAALTPGTGAYLLETGSRNRAAWRVTRVREARIIHLRAVRAVEVRSVAQYAKLPAGQRAFQIVTVDARSRPTDECHSGTYRDVAGPIIGDALATARTRAYVDVT